ncbi:MAG: helix-turn-helix transcriptional regulator [Thermodesulfobacteriota bacterium]
MNVRLKTLDPGFLDLKAAAAYTSLSVRTLRVHIKKPGGPPIYRVVGKILLKRSDLDRWLESFKIDLDSLANSVLESFRAQHSR